MPSQQLRSQIDRIWDLCWSGGMSDPRDVLQHIGHLLFLRHLDALQTAEENAARRPGQPLPSRIFPAGCNEQGLDYATLRWSRFKHLAAADMYAVLRDHVFPFLRALGGTGPGAAQQVGEPGLTLPAPASLAQVVDLLDSVPLAQRPANGDLYGYALNKMASAGQNGRCPTPAHLVRLLVELTAPTATDFICDPASGHCDYLVAAAAHLRDAHPEIGPDARSLQHFRHAMFHAYDIDPAARRVGGMNLALQGGGVVQVRYLNWRARDPADDDEKYTLLLATLPFSAPPQDADSAQNPAWPSLARALRLLQSGGRAAFIVPERALHGARPDLRRRVLEEQQLDAVICLPPGIFKPHAGSAILLFSKPELDAARHVWFYDMRAEGGSLDDRSPDVLTRWRGRDGSELARPRSAPSFCVAQAEIAAHGYHLCIDRYRLQQQ